MEEWNPLKPELFKKKPYHPGCDIYYGSCSGEEQ
jgi:hypothetical protein